MFTLAMESLVKNQVSSLRFLARPFLPRRGASLAHITPASAFQWGDLSTTMWTLCGQLIELGEIYRARPYQGRWT